MNRLTNKIALVTGGSSGIGLEIARLFVAEGAKVVITARRDDALQESSAEMPEGTCVTLAGDVAKADDAQRMIDKAVQTWGRLDIVVNNAGVVRRDRKLHEIDEDDWDTHLGINLKSVFLISKAALPIMMEQGGGVFVNLSSQLAFVAAPKYPAYCAAKAGVIGLTRSVALDYGDRNIRANCLCPGLVQTPLAYVQREDFDPLLPDVVKLHPLGRIGQPRDIADAAVFLASDESSWITGQSLIVDGGYTIR